MSSSRSTALPLGYSLRLATQQDLGRILFFIWHDSHLDIIIITLLVMLPIMLWQLIHKYSMLLMGMFLFNFIVASILLCSLIFGYLNLRKCIRNNLFSVLLVEDKNKICGYINYEKLRGCTILHILFVGKADRRKGIASFLIEHCKSIAKKPIYLVSYSHLKKFYYYRGFVNANYSNVPGELSRWRQKQHVQIMVFNEINE
jgi:GNAT superfamily N-acetyltransferase